MKKFLAILLTLVLAFAIVACNDVEEIKDNETDVETPVTTPDPVEPVFDPAAKGEGVMTYAEYAAAELETQVVIEAYVQDNQSWWDNKITVYTQDPDGAYFLYEMPCSEEDAAKLTKGTKIKVTGYKAEWSGEVEIIDSTFEILDGTWVAEAEDLTSLLGTDELINKQNVLAKFTGLTVANISYKDDEYDKDIYVDFTLGENTYSFCVENYHNGPDTDVYKAVQALQIGDVVDVEGFLYWYNGPNVHITAVSTVAE